MAKAANLTIRVETSGDNRRGTITRVPISAQATAVIGPPNALNLNSSAEQTFWQLQSGDNTLLMPTSFTSAYPVYYVVSVPPTNSVNGKLLKGNAGDVGVSLVPYLPMCLALATTTTQIIINSQIPEQNEVWIL